MAPGRGRRRNRRRPLLSDRIVLNNMVFHGRHGWYEEERREPQRFEVDLELHLDLQPAGTRDDLAASVDYGAVFELTQAVVETQSFRLLETLAETISAAAVARFAAVDEVVVRVRKPQVQLGGRLDWAGVEIRRRRPSGEPDPG